MQFGLTGTYELKYVGTPVRMPTGRALSLHPGHLVFIENLRYCTSRRFLSFMFVAWP